MSDLYYGEYPVDMTPEEARHTLTEQQRLNDRIEAEQARMARATTDPNPLREDEVAAVSEAIQSLMADWLADDGTVDDHHLAIAAITALDQVRENRPKDFQHSPQQQAYEAQSRLGIVPLPGYPVDQVREGRK